MVSLKELKSFVGKKVKDFALINGNDNFSIVFEDNTLLKFSDEPYECGRVQDIGPSEKEEPKKDSKPILERINSALNKIWLVFKIALKVILIILVILGVYWIIAHWGDISDTANKLWEGYLTWSGQN